MPRLAANLSFLFTELPFLDRFAAAAAAGFRAVEYMFPYGEDSDEIRRRLDEHDLQQVLFNLPAGDWAGGERGIACLPGREAEFRRGVQLALPLAKKFGVRRLNALAGTKPRDVADDDCRRVMLGNLRYAADLLGDADIRLLVEPINSRIDMPGFWLDTPAKAVSLLEALGHPNVFLQYDIYHAHVMGEDVLAALPARLPAIAHIQLADSPGRHQPGTGDIPFDDIFRWLDASGYAGWVGCEYRPRAASTDSFGWAAAWLANRAG